LGVPLTTLQKDLLTVDLSVNLIPIERIATMDEDLKKVLSEAMSQEGSVSRRRFLRTVVAGATFGTLALSAQQARGDCGGGSNTADCNGQNTCNPNKCGPNTCTTNTCYPGSNECSPNTCTTLNQCTGGNTGNCPTSANKCNTNKCFQHEHQSGN